MAGNLTTRPEFAIFWSGIAPHYALHRAHVYPTRSLCRATL